MRNPVPGTRSHIVRSETPQALKRSACAADTGGMTDRISRGDIIGAIGAALLLFSLSRVWYGLSFSDLGRGVNPKAFGVTVSNANLIQKTGWSANGVVGLILLACGVAVAGIVVSRVSSVGIANRPGDIVRGAGAAAATLVLVRMIFKPSLIPGTQASFISGVPGPHLELGIYIALIGACAMVAAGFLMEIDDAKVAAAAIWEPPLAEAQMAGTMARPNDVPDFLTQPPAWVSEHAPQRVSKPPGG